MNRFEAGRRFKSRGRPYRILGTKDHWTRDDRYVEMIRYQSVCAGPGCKRLFEALTTKTRLRRGQLNKRCQLHHAPGMPAPVVKVRRKRSKKPTAVQLAARWAWLGRKAALAVQRGQPPSYLD